MNALATLTASAVLPTPAATVKITLVQALKACLGELKADTRDLLSPEDVRSALNDVRIRLGRQALLDFCEETGRPNLIASGERTNKHTLNAFRKDPRSRIFLPRSLHEKHADAVKKGRTNEKRSEAREIYLRAGVIYTLAREIRVLEEVESLRLLKELGF